MYRPRRTTAAAAASVVLATAGGLLTVAAAPASAADCAAPAFERQFFANTTFSGTPAKTDCDDAIAENWGAGAPASGLPSNRFGVRWSVTRDFGSGGPFALTASGQDGIRVYLDGELRIDLWQNTSTTVSRTVDVTIPSGQHSLRVDYVNWSGPAAVRFAYTPRTSPADDQVAPLAPAGVAASYDESAGRASVTWARNEELDLAGYRVYRRASEGGDFLPVSGANLLTETSFTQDLPATGAAYAYQVRAVDLAGNESTGGAEPTVTTADRTAPALSAPTATHDNWLGVSLAWTAEEEGLTYDVQRASSPDGEFTALGTVSAPGYRDETAPYGETSYYRVTATDAAGNTTTSPVVEFARPLAVPSMDGTRIADDDSGVEVAWTSPASGPSTFRVYRWDRFDENAVPEPVTCEPRRTGNPEDPKPQYACTDTTAEFGVTYWYRVHTVDAQGRESEPSQPSSITRADRVAPPAVTGLDYTTTEYGTVLSWDASPAADLARYVVYRAPADDPFATIERIAEVAPGTTGHADVQVADDQSWIYYVDAVDTSGNSLYLTGSPSDVAHVETNEYYLGPTYNLPFTYDWALSATVDASAQAQLSWNCTTGSCPATGFHVYRWDRVTEEWVRLTQQPLSAATRAYTDAATPRGTTSHYTITAVAADGSEIAARYTSIATAPSGA
ncbi:fibronectin type III domain-containing protein [Streptomyces sp. NPDC058739]|uniref:fibronectin type III domain-containing protein n=1 Tax=Streptomyces sp. NPDC058739 TaxID=3346618 RepID=UPI00368E8A6B